MLLLLLSGLLVEVDILLLLHLLLLLVNKLILRVRGYPYSLPSLHPIDILVVHQLGLLLLLLVLTIWLLL